MPKELVVYCAASILESHDVDPRATDWDILYETPGSLFNNHISKRPASNGKNNAFYCPAVKNLSKRTFVIKNPLRSKFNYDLQTGKIEAEHLSMDGVLDFERAFANHWTMQYNVKWIFFCAEDIEMTVTPPYFHFSNIANNAMLVPGVMNINSWFRNLHPEYILNPDCTSLELKEDDPLMYVSFNTDRPVKLKKFSMTPELRKIENACTSSVRWEPFVPIEKRYKRFKQSLMREKTLKLIKESSVINSSN